MKNAFGIYKSFTSEEEVVECMKQLQVEENVYLRRGKCVSLKSFKNDVWNRTKISKSSYQKFQYICPKCINQSD